MTDPKYLSLALDIGWVAKAGGDPKTFLINYFNRVKYLHLRDIKGEEFVELGKGTIEYPAIFQELKKRNFRGWAVVEIAKSGEEMVQDPFHSVSISRNYLRERIGI